MLKSSNYFTLFVGYAFIILGRAMGTSIPPNYIISLGIAGALFAVADFLQFLEDYHKEAVELQMKIPWYLKIGVHVAPVGSYTANMVAVFAIITLPFAFKEKSSYGTLSDVVTLISLGIVIFLIGLRQVKDLKIIQHKYHEEKDNLINVMREVKEIRDSMQEQLIKQEQALAIMDRLHLSKSDDKNSAQ